MEKKPLVSIIIPLYNQKQYIKRAIESALNQTYKNIEIIVVNDGSTDNPEKILDHYKKKIIIVNQKNQGLSAARNRGIKIAKGKYIQFLDADDELLPQKIEKQIDFFRKNSQYDIIVCRTFWVDENGKVISIQKKFKSNKNLLYTFLIENQFPIHAALIKADIFNHLGFFDISLTALEDWDLWLRAIYKGFSFKFFNDILIKYYIHEDSMSKNGLKMYENRIKILHKYKTIFEKNRNIEQKAIAYNKFQNGLLMLSDKYSMEKGIEFIVEGIKLNPNFINNFDFFYHFYLYFNGNNQKNILNISKDIMEKIIHRIEKGKISKKTRFFYYAAYAINFYKIGEKKQGNYCLRKSLQGNLLYIFCFMKLLLVLFIKKTYNGNKQL